MAAKLDQRGTNPANRRLIRSAKRETTTGSATNPRSSRCNGSKKMIQIKCKEKLKLHLVSRKMARSRRRRLRSIKLRVWMYLPAHLGQAEEEEIEAVNVEMADEVEVETSNHMLTKINKSDKVNQKRAKMKQMQILAAKRTKNVIKAQILLFGIHEVNEVEEIEAEANEAEEVSLQTLVPNTSRKPMASSGNTSRRMAEGLRQLPSKIKSMPSMIKTSTKTHREVEVTVDVVEVAEEEEAIKTPIQEVNIKLVRTSSKPERKKEKIMKEAKVAEA